MVHVTISVAAAFIAAGIAVLHFLLPNALALILTDGLGDSHSAVSWSVVSGFLLSTNWPLFLGSDTAASTEVERKLALVTWIRPLGLLLTTVAGIVTPLGLRDVLGPALNTKNVTFAYAADLGPIGLGTPSRSNFGFQRTCYDVLCPGMPDVGNVTLYSGNMTKSQRIQTPAVPQSLVDLYQSGLDGQKSSMSSFFDIQSRQFIINSPIVQDIIHNDSILSPSYRVLTSIVMNNKYELFEGVISDTIDGGIGFRNHSVPVGLQYGAEWEEDILWLTPDVVCVDTNTSTTIVRLNGNPFASADGNLTDRGGFINLNRTLPIPDDDYPWPDTQASPNLYARTYQTAWSTNVNNMFYLNVSQPNTNRSRISSELGQSWQVNSSLTASYGFDTLFRNLDLNSIANSPSPSDTSMDAAGRSGIPNPWNVTSENFGNISDWCKGAVLHSAVNMTTIAAMCGILAAPGQSKDSRSSSGIADVNVTYERPIYICSAATKLSIKVIRFHYNSTTENNLNGLQIMTINDKKYSNEDEMPLWGGETPVPAWQLAYLNPLFGIIDPTLASSANMSTRRSAYFYIPASRESVDVSAGLPTSISSGWGDYLPAVRLPSMIWTTVFSEALTTGIDYTGATNLPMQLLWSQLSQNATGAAKILRLIFTDYAVNAMMGTRGIHNSQQKIQNPQNLRKLFNRDTVPVAQYPVHVLQYKLHYDWLYGIPALISIGLVVCVVLFAMYSAMFGRGTLQRLKQYLAGTSPGRILAAQAYPDLQHDRYAPTEEWIKTVGHKQVKLEGWSSGADICADHTPAKLSGTPRSKEKVGVQYTQIEQRDVEAREDQTSEPTSAVRVSSNIVRKPVGSGIRSGIEPHIA